MLKLFNKEHKAINVLTSINNYKTEYSLTGEDYLEFSLLNSDENIKYIENECYIRNEENEYIIKSIDPGVNEVVYKADINLETLKGKTIKHFDMSNVVIDDILRTAISGTGWILSSSNITKRRTVRLTNTNSLEVIREVRKVFKVDLRFNSIDKTISVYEEFGKDRGAYFIEDLNIISLYNPSTSYNYITRLFPYGKDGLSISSVNANKEYIDNFQYSTKIIEHIWKDERYTDAESLKEDAILKLNELSKPTQHYEVSVVDLASQSTEYNFLEFFLGDTVTLLSESKDFRDKQRIVKYIKYHEEPHKNVVELGNIFLSFEEIQKENEYKNQVIYNITTDSNTINGSTIDEISTKQIKDFETNVVKAVDLTAINASITNLTAQNVNITGELNTVKANIGTLNSNVATIDKLTVTHTAQINNLKATSVTTTQLQAVNANIGTLEVEVGKIHTLVNGNLSSENIQAGGITSDKLTISNGFITNAMIANLDVSKINAGDISTNKFKIKSDDGGIEIVGATQQFKDKNNRVRVQIGKDTQGNFNFLIKGEDGTTTIIDHTGIKSNAIANDLIVSNMIASDAVGEKQVNYSSFATGFNKDTNTTTLKSTKILLNNQNQTLDIAFNQLKTQADGTKTTTESNTTQLNVQQGKIESLIANTTIVKDGQTTTLKDAYNKTVSTVDSMNSTIGSHTTKINDATGKITGVETKVNTVERNLSSITQRVSSTETNVTTIDNKANNALNIANNANSKIDSLEIGSRNLVRNSAPTSTGWQHWSNPNTLTTMEEIISEPTSLNKKAMKITVGGTGVGSTGRHTSPVIRPTKGKKYSWSIYLKSSRSLKAAIGVESGLTKTVEVTTEWQKFEHTATATDGKYYGFIVRISGNATAGDNLYFHSVMFVEGDKVPTWSPAPEDFQSQITTTNNKVASIETNLTSITSRVGSVETTQTTVNNKVTALETWKRDAEVKITDNSIISTVSSQFYKKSETDTKYATQTQISQLNNQIALKVDVAGVKSAIELNPNSLKIGFNKIDNRAEFTNDGFFFRDMSGKKCLSLKRGYLHTYTHTDETLNTAIIPRATSGNFGRGCSIIGAQNSHFFSIGRDLNWLNDTQTTISPTEYMIINYRDRGSDLKMKVGTHFYGGMVHAHNGLYTTSISSGYYKNANGDDAFAIFSDVINYKNWNFNGKNLVGANIVRSAVGIEVLNNITKSSRNSPNIDLFDSIEVSKTNSYHRNSLLNQILDISNVSNKEDILIDNNSADLSKLFVVLFNKVKEQQEEINKLKAGS